MRERTKTHTKNILVKIGGAEVVVLVGTDLNLAPVAEVEEGSDPPILLLV